MGKSRRVQPSFLGQETSGGNIFPALAETVRRSSETQRVGTTPAPRMAEAIADLGGAMDRWLRWATLEFSTGPCRGVKGGVGGESPCTREGRNVPAVQMAVASGRWSVFGYWFLVFCGQRLVDGCQWTVACGWEMRWAPFLCVTGRGWGGDRGAMRGSGQLAGLAGRIAQPALRLCCCSWATDWVSRSMMMARKTMASPAMAPLPG